MRHKKKSKSQVTMFIVIVIFTIVVFSIILITVGRSNRRSIDTVQVKMIQTEISSSQFNSFLQSCLDSSFAEAIFLLGMQGGVIYSSQGGNFDFNVTKKSLEHDGRNYDVVFLNDYFHANRNIANIPFYPCLRDDISESLNLPVLFKSANCFRNYTFKSFDIDKYINFGVFQNIERNLDMNLLLCSERKEINVSGLPQPVCDKSPFEIRNKYSWENQIRTYLENKMDSCVAESESFLKEELGAEFDFIGEYDTEFVFNDESTIVEFKFPLRIKFDRFDTTNTILSYSSSINVRLKTIYSFIYGGMILLKDYNTNMFVFNREGVIANEILKFRHDLKEEKWNFFNKFGITGINLTREYISDGNFIQIVDNESLIRGKNFVFNLFLNNRPPALDYFTFYPSENHDVHIYEGENIVFTPIAYDPDDEGKRGNLLMYEYEILNKDWQWRQDYFTNNELYKTGNMDGFSCIHPLHGITQNRCSMFRVNESDLGEHLVRITVTDSSGARDWQDVRIFIDTNSDLQFEIFNLYNLFYFNDSRRFSVVSEEDPFILNFSNSVFSEARYTDKIVWTDIKNDEIIFPKFQLNELKKHENLSIMPPYTYVLNPEKYVQFNEAIRNYNNAFSRIKISDNLVINYYNSLENFYSIFDNFNKRGYPYAPTNRKTSVKLDYYKHNNIVETKKRDLLIAECFPFRSETPSYPFNFIMESGNFRNMNPFLANNTCCEGNLSLNPLDWKRSEDGTICYSSFRIGTYQDFILDEEIKIDPILLQKVYPDYIPLDFNTVKEVSLTGESVDKYVRVVKGTCNGERGNVCHPSEYTIRKIPYCGMNYSTNYENDRMDLKIKNSDFSSLNDEYYTNSENVLCVLWNQTSYSSQVINMSEGGSVLEKYVCFNSRSVPYKVQDLPCELEKCEEIDVSLYRADETSRNISKTYFYRPRQSPFPLCLCGNEVVNISEKGDKYCCNPYGGDNIVGTLNDCNAGLPEELEIPEVPDPGDPGPIADIVIDWEFLYSSNYDLTFCTAFYNKSIGSHLNREICNKLVNPDLLNKCLEDFSFLSFYIFDDSSQCSNIEDSYYPHFPHNPDNSARIVCYEYFSGDCSPLEDDFLSLCNSLKNDYPCDPSYLETYENCLIMKKFKQIINTATISTTECDVFSGTPLKSACKAIKESNVSLCLE